MCSSASSRLRMNGLRASRIRSVDFERCGSFVRPIQRVRQRDRHRWIKLQVEVAHATASVCAQNASKDSRPDSASISFMAVRSVSSSRVATGSCFQFFTAAAIDFGGSRHQLAGAIGGQIVQVVLQVLFAIVRICLFGFVAGC